MRISASIQAANQLNLLSHIDSNNEKFDESTVLNLSYSTVKSIRAVKPTIHKYLSGYVRSRFRRIDADEFTIATLLPVQRFKKASADVVWRESRGMI